MFKRLICPLAAVLTIFILAVPAVVADTQDGSMSGAVIDQSGQPIPGVKTPPPGIIFSAPSTTAVR